ncbi:MAG: ComEC/Rec2 family competence protein, partial [Candidatus Auribacterota bacterium]|nr:ComEC/Rec2 family competence protein [Candidatus Auribacterota bacterium]
KEADRSFYREDYEDALAGYEKLEKVLQGIKEDYPGWSANLIETKLKKCRERIEESDKFLTEINSWKRPLKVHFIDVGQGDSILIQCPDKTTLLIDGGKIWCYPFLEEYLRRAGVEEIDYLIVSHPHGDHYGGLIKILNTFKIDTILVSGQVDTTDHYQRFVETINKLKDIKYRVARAGNKYSFGDVKLLIMHPSSRLPDSINDCSIIARLTYGEESFLFTGDAEEDAELEAIGRGYNMKSTILKVAHHGSRTSTDQYFLSRVAPEEAVICVGENNAYGHPTPQVLRRLKRGGIKTYRTDLDGTIVYLSNGKEHRVELPGHAVYPEYDILAKNRSKIIANRETLIYYKPREELARRVPPTDRVYFDTGAAAENAGYRRVWY